MRRTLRFATLAMTFAMASGGAPTFAAQVLTPVRANVDISSTPVTLPAGAVLSFQVEYQVDALQTKDEAGLGLRVEYDSNLFEVINPATAVSSLVTRCLIARPSDQPAGDTARQVVFIWADTALYSVPAVGWPGTASPTGTPSVHGCLNPAGVAKGTAAITNFPVALFRIDFRSKPSFSSGTSAISLITAGNVSHAAWGNVDSKKTIVVNGMAALVASLDVDASVTSTKYDALTDGLLVLRYLFGLTGSPLINGALGGTATRSEPSEVKAYLDDNRVLLDVDGDGTADALTDGLLVIRYLLGLRGAALITSVVSPLASRKSAQELEAYLQSIMP